MKRGLVLSSVLHVSLFVLLLIGPGPKPFDWDRVDAIPVDLVAPTWEERFPETEPPKIERQPEPELKRIDDAPPVTDVVEVPDPEPEPEPVQEKPEPKPKPKPKPRRILRKEAPKRTEQPSLAERLQGRLSETTEPDTTEQKTAVTPPPAPAATKTAEVEAADFPYAWYLNGVRTRIADSWDPPGDRMIAGKVNQVMIRFRVHRDGHVSDIEVQNDSGTPGLDASARRAIERASPFPPLPTPYQGDVLDAAVRFTVSGDGA